MLPGLSGDRQALYNMEVRGRWGGCAPPLPSSLWVGKAPQHQVEGKVESIADGQGTSVAKQMFSGRRTHNTHLGQKRMDGGDEPGS